MTPLRFLYPGAPRGLMFTHMDELNGGILSARARKPLGRGVILRKWQSGL